MTNICSFALLFFALLFDNYYFSTETNTDPDTEPAALPSVSLSSRKKAQINNDEDDD